MTRTRKPDAAITPAEAFDDDERESHELGAEENADLCAGCIKCCTYITIEIDSPRSPEEYDQWIWALYHDHISIFLEKPEKWFVQVDTRCGKLNAQGRCSVYGRHPVLCRQYDARSCERRLPLLDIVKVFDTGEQLEEWLRDRRPVHYRRLQAFRRQFPVVGVPAEPHLVNIEQPARRRDAANGNGSRRRSPGPPAANGRRPKKSINGRTSGRPAVRAPARTARGSR